MGIASPGFRSIGAASTRIAGLSCSTDNPGLCLLSASREKFVDDSRNVAFFQSLLRRAETRTLPPIRRHRPSLTSVAPARPQDDRPTPCSAAIAPLSPPEVPPPRRRGGGGGCQVTHHAGTKLEARTLPPTHTHTITCTTPLLTHETPRSSLFHIHFCAAAGTKLETRTLPPTHTHTIPCTSPLLPPPSSAAIAPLSPSEVPPPRRRHPGLA